MCSQMNVDPEDLIPKLPRPKDLQPFPTTQALVSTEIGPVLNLVSSEGVLSMVAMVRLFS